MAWNGSFDDVDWAAKGFLDDFVKACNERLIHESLYVPFPLITIGQDVSAAGFIQKFQSIADYFPASVWVNPALYDPDNPHPTTYDVTHTRQTLFEAAGVNTNGFRRKRPREVKSTAIFAPHDRFNNPAVIGQKAWVYELVNPFPFPLEENEYDLVEWDGTQWTAISGYDADVLDSELPSPNHCPWGFIEHGDFIGPWIWTEIRDLLNEMEMSYHGAGPVQGGFTQTGGSERWLANPTVIHRTWSSAYNSAVSHPVNPALTNTGGYIENGPQESEGYPGMVIIGTCSFFRPYEIGQTDGYEYLASLGRNWRKFGVLDVSTRRPRTIKVYGMIRGPNELGITNYFNGEGYIENEYNLLATFTGADGPNPVSDYIGNNGVPSTTHEPTCEGQFLEGWGVESSSFPGALYPFAVAKWDFEYNRDT